MKKVLFVCSPEHFSYGFYALEKLPEKEIELEIVDYSVALKKMEEKNYNTILFAHDIRGGEFFKKVTEITEKRKQKLCRLSYKNDLSGNDGYFSIQMSQSDKFIKNIRTVVLER